MSDPVKDSIALLSDGHSVPQTMLQAAFEDILSGNSDPVLISAFLMGLRCKGETAEDIEAGARIMRQHARRIDAPDKAVDTCGTGGLPFVTLNTSTASAFVTAGAGGCSCQTWKQISSSKNGICGCSGSSGCQSYPFRRSGQGSLLKGPGRLSIRSGASFCHAACGSRQKDAGPENHFQPVGTALQSCRHQTASDRNVQSGMAGTLCSGSPKIGIRARHDRSW